LLSAHVTAPAYTQPHNEGMSPVRHAWRFAPRKTAQTASVVVTAWQRLCEEAAVCRQKNVSHQRHVPVAAAYRLRELLFRAATRYEGMGKPRRSSKPVALPACAYRGRVGSGKCMPCTQQQCAMSFSTQRYGKAVGTPVIRQENMWACTRMRGARSEPLMVQCARVVR